MILNPGMDLTLRPMKYPKLFEMYKDAIKNTWTVEEVDFSEDLKHLRHKMSDADARIVKRLVAFFATGDSIVANNLVLNLYKHINAPEARMYLSRQLYEEALHVEFYLTLLDTYIPNHDERAEAFAAVENIPSIKKKAEFCFKWIDSINNLESLETDEDKRSFLLNLICFACCIEGLFFFGAFAYVYFLRSKGLLHGLASGTNWVFRDESCHMEFAFEVIDIVKAEMPELFNKALERSVSEMIQESVECEYEFAEDALSGNLELTSEMILDYLKYTADQRMARLGFDKIYNVGHNLNFMNLQNIAENTNFFERRVSAYSANIGGGFSTEADF